MPKVSVILTSFNHGRFVAEAIDSVLRQSFADFELIIWDDASSDDSWEVIGRHSDPRIKAFRNDVPMRAIAGVNRAIAEVAKGAYVALHHSDDVWEQDKLRRQVEFLDAHPRVGAVFSDALAIDESGQPVVDQQHFYSSIFRQDNRSRFEWLNHFFRRGNALCHPSVLIRKRCYDEVGLYRYGFAQVGDLDMWMRLCFKYDIHVLPEKLVRFRVLESERNTSGSRPDTRVRWITESFLLLRNYLRIRTYREMVAIFPEAAQYYRRQGFEPHFVLAMIALAEHPFHFTKLFGLELLYGLMADEAKARRIKALYGFDYRNLIELAAKHDVFSHEHASALQGSIAERDGRIAELTHAVAEREREGGELRQSLSAREADIAHMHEAVAERDAEIAGLRTAVSKREADLSRMHDAISDRDTMIAGLNRVVSVRDSRISEMAEAVSERDRRLGELARTVLARDDELRRLQADIVELERKLAKSDELVADRERKLEALGLVIAEKSAAIAVLEESIRHREAQVRENRDVLAQLTERSAQLQRDLSARESDLHHMHGAVAARDSQLAELSAHLAQRDERIKNLENAQAALEAGLADLSARLTNPEDTRIARAVRAIRGGPSRGWNYLRALRWRSKLADCPFMDGEWYLANNPDIANKGRDPVVHYLASGWREGREPGPAFDGKYYLSRYPDVEASGMPPLLHFWLHGRNEGRHPTRETEAQHRKHQRWHRRLLRCPLFDSSWYLRTYPDVADSGSDPAWHYVVHGWRQDRQPGPEFDVHYYRRRYPDLAHHDGPLLLHFWRHGRFEGRCANASLDFEAIQAEARIDGIAPGTTLELDVSGLEGRDAPYMSVIIPTYNRIQRLPGIIECWRKVAASTRFAFEIIFSDDGSSDGSVEYLESVEGLPLRVLRNEHGGPSRARNAAIRAATGERLFIIGDDIYPDLDILNAHAALAQRLGRKVATLGVVDWHEDLHVNHLMHHITEIGFEQFSYSLLRNDAFTDFRHFYTCNVCLDRELVLEERVIFDETFDRAAFEDVELFYRLSLRGMKLFYTTRARGVHYHPYQVEGFSRRQSGAGQMAVVFARLHPAVDRVIGVSALAWRARKGRRLGVSEATWHDRAKALMRRCDRYEAVVSAVPIEASLGIRRRLSAIYSRLFRAMYEHGILQRLSKCANPLAVAMSGHFDSDWDRYWAAIDQRGDPEGDWPAAECLDLAMAVDSGGGSGDLYTSRQRAILEELACIPPLEFSTMPPMQGDTARFEAAHAGLIVERSDPSRAKAIAEFRRAFPGKGSVFERSPDGGLARIRDDGSAANPVPAADLEVAAFHWPTSAASMLPPDHLLGAYMALVENGVGLAVVSNSLTEGPAVTTGALRDHLVFSRQMADAVMRNAIMSVPFSGKVLRLLPASGPAAENSLEALLGAPIEWKGDGAFESRAAGPSMPNRYLPDYLPRRAKVRPVVLVLPIFLAVGGVERNAVEIMRRLNHHFDFVVVTMERLRPEQGSLAGQAIEVASAVIEMPEIAGQPDYLRILYRLRQAYKPDLVWVCNGSPWFCDHATEIRRLFAQIPIVDQEAYDTHQGWIARYGEPGIRSFDYFVAINRKIERRFLEDFGIPPERTRLIYSAIDAKRIREFKSGTRDGISIRKRFAIPEGRQVFTFVARLTDQKRPLLFLEIAKRRVNRGDECFVLVGDGELASEAEAFIERNALHNVVRIPYVANTLELHELSQGIIFTSAYEGLPIAMLEALAMGVPVFATDTGDIGDILRHYGSGSVVPVDSTPDALEQAFGQWVACRNAYAASARRAEEAVLERFSSESIAGLYADLWTTAIGRYARAAA